MTIDNVTAGTLIDPAWGNAVADQLNELPPAMQYGKDTVSHTAGVSQTITFPDAFAAAPTIVVTAVAIGTGVEWSYAVRSLSATSFTMYLVGNGTASAGSMTYHWTAIGALA